MKNLLIGLSFLLSLNALASLNVPDSIYAEKLEESFNSKNKYSHFKVVKTSISLSFPEVYLIPMLNFAAALEDRENGGDLAFDDTDAYEVHIDLIDTNISEKVTHELNCRISIGERYNAVISKYLYTFTMNDCYLENIESGEGNYLRDYSYKQIEWNREFAY